MSENINPTPVHEERCRCTIAQIVSPIVGAGLMIFLMLYMSGFFASGLVGPDTTAPVLKLSLVPNETATAEAVEIPIIYRAMGTVESKITANVAAQIQARILTVKVDEGDHVKKGDLLITLDDEEFVARRNQAQSALDAAAASVIEAQQGLIAAEANYERAKLEYERYAKLFKDKAATPEQKEGIDAQYRQAKASVEQAKQAVQGAQASVKRAQQVLREAEIMLGYTKIYSPMDGIVSQRLADPGDLALPGKPLVVIYDPHGLRLEAVVRETLIGHVKTRRKFEVEITSLGCKLEGSVEEIVPTADPVSRTFVVKVALPFREDLYPGMFGRLLIPIGKRKAILIPKECWQRVGQLDTVVVKDGKKWRRIYVKVGQERGDKVEVLSGLNGGETLGILEREER